MVVRKVGSKVDWTVARLAAWWAELTVELMAEQLAGQSAPKSAVC